MELTEKAKSEIESFYQSNTLDCVEYNLEQAYQDAIEMAESDPKNVLLKIPARHTKTGIYTSLYLNEGAFIK